MAAMQIPPPHPLLLAPVHAQFAEFRFQQAHAHPGALFLAHREGEAAALAHAAAPHHALHREPLSLASAPEISHALQALGVSHELADSSAALACEAPYVRAVLCGVVHASLALNEAAWKFSQELHQRGAEAGEGAVVPHVEGEWAAAKASALHQLETGLALYDASVKATGGAEGSGLDGHELTLAAWRAFEAFLDAKVHCREARREAWERAERLKLAHAAAVLPPAGMFAAVLKASMLQMPRHPDAASIVSQGGGGGGGGGGAGVLGVLPSGLLGGPLGDPLIHVDHCASEDLPKELDRLLVHTIRALAAVTPASPTLARVQSALASASPAAAAKGAAASPAPPQLA